jgi:hypothetical protein
MHPWLSLHTMLEPKDSFQGISIINNRNLIIYIIAPSQTQPIPITNEASSSNPMPISKNFRSSPASLSPSPGSGIQLEGISSPGRGPSSTSPGPFPTMGGLPMDMPMGRMRSQSQLQQPLPMNSPPKTIYDAHGARARSNSLNRGEPSSFPKVLFDIVISYRNIDYLMQLYLSLEHKDEFIYERWISIWKSSFFW